MRLKGINSLAKKLADGTVKTYWYAWKGGPRIDAEPSTPEFIRLYSEAVAAKAKKSTETFSSLIDYFKDQSEYTGLGDKSKRAYDQYLALIEAKFGSMPIGAIEDKRARGDFKAFRNTFAATPRKADYVWTTIARVLSVAKDHGKIAVNVCERGGRLYDADRSEFASITGHSMTTVQEILDAHYLGGRVELAESAIKKLSEVYGQGQK
jgi:hypothetical protein